MAMTKIKFSKTQRGFGTGTFTDRYGKQCSIQKSSLASEHCIWLGIDDAEPKIMVSDAVKLGISNDPNPVGWMSFFIPEEVSLNTRMHLTQEQVKELLPVLQRFVETGEI